MSNFGLIQLIKRNCAPMTHTKFDNGIRFFFISGLQIVSMSYNLSSLHPAT